MSPEVIAVPDPQFDDVETGPDTNLSADGDFDSEHEEITIELNDVELISVNGV